jgi:hypothetical protein
LAADELAAEGVAVRIDFTLIVAQVVDERARRDGTGTDDQSTK